jgi:hypothetical protein
MTDEEILRAKSKNNRNGGCNKKPGRKTKKPVILKPKQDKFVQIYLDTGNKSLAKKEAGYSQRYDVFGNKDVAKTINEKRQEMWAMFMEHAEEALNVQLDIMRSDKAGFKTRLDATNSILDRAGLKPAERKEITGADGGAVQVESSAANELAQRARMLLAEKVNIIDV